MPMMYVGVVCVTVRLSRMRVNMDVRFSAIPSSCMFMLVMCIVPMAVSMRERCMHVQMFMAFAHVQPNSQRHQ